MPAYPKSLSDTVSKMQKHKSLTLQWDIVVNYSVDAINKLLESESSENKPGSTLRFTFHGFDDEAMDERSIDCVFRLGAPRIQFNSRSDQFKGPSCNLFVPIVGGTVNIHGRDPVAVPSDAYTLVLMNLELRTAEGPWDTNPKRHDKVFTFCGETRKGAVIIAPPLLKSDFEVDFRRQSSHVPDIPIIDTNSGRMTESIERLFLRDRMYRESIRYEIACIVSTSQYQLRLESFLFDAFPLSDTPDEKDPGILTLFIQTRRPNYGNQGLHQPVKVENRDEYFSLWGQMWHEKLKCSPVPEGHTASIIFSKEMIYESAVKPTLNGKEFTAQRIDPGGKTIKMEVTPEGRVQSRSQFLTELSSAGYSSRITSVDVPAPKLTLELTEHDSSGITTISSDCKYDYEWSTTPPNYGGGLSVPQSHGSVKATHELREFRRATLGDHRFVFDFSVSSSNWKAVGRTPNPLTSIGSVNTVPNWAVTEPSFPEIKITLADVNFFLASNLFPGDKHVIEVDKKSGLHIPGDFYLVGKVVDK